MLAGCAGEAAGDPTVALDLPVDAKTDGTLTLCVDAPVSLPGAPTSQDIQSVEVELTASAFRAVVLADDASAAAPVARLVVSSGDTHVFGQGGEQPSVLVDTGAERRRWSVRVENLGRTDLVGRLCFSALSPSVPDPSKPHLEVRFTRPLCAARPEDGIAEGIFCEDYDDRGRSRQAAGILDQLRSWIDDARRAAEAGEDVTLTMAYLSWRDGRIYDALCAATRAGVRLEGFFDTASEASQPPRLEADASCRAPGQDNIRIRRLGGRTIYDDATGEREWRLMHVKLMMFEVAGAPTTRLVFGSANLSSSATSVHFENWVFAEFPSDSHFVASHRCDREALAAASELPYPDDAPEFDRVLSECLGHIETAEDPHYRVFFSPDDHPEYVSGGISSRSMRALLSQMQGAQRSVKVAAQHFSALAMASRLREVGADPAVTTRLILDDDTFYSQGESSSDADVYSGYIRDSQVSTRFMQTNHGRYQYQHNKYVLIDDERVFMGAGNFTEAAFIDNYENFYLIDDPAFVQAYVEHFARMNGLSRPAQELPSSPPAP